MTITTAMVKELREKTGAGPLDCKKALEAHGGDMALAAEALREKGLARAAKKAERETRAGLVVVTAGPGAAAGVEVTCETDFVARTTEFRDLAHRAAERMLAEAGPADAQALLQASHDGAGGQAFAQVVQGLIGKLGENIVIRRAARYSAKQGSVVAGYVHAGAVAGTFAPDEGRVGVLVRLGAPGLEAQQAALDQLAHDLALHIASAAPRYVKPEDVPAEVLSEERERLLEEVRGESKPEAIKAQIVAGRLAKFTKSVSLLPQPYLKDDTLTVGEFLQQQGDRLGGTVEVLGFERLEAGE